MSMNQFNDYKKSIPKRVGRIIVVNMKVNLLKIKTNKKFHSPHVLSLMVSTFGNPHGMYIRKLTSGLVSL